MTLSVRIIPCLDVTDGRVVKGINFTNLVDAGDPRDGCAFMILKVPMNSFLDISASSSGRETTFDIVRKTAEQVFYSTYSWRGIRSVGDVDQLFASRRRQDLNQYCGNCAPRIDRRNRR